MIRSSKLSLKYLNKQKKEFGKRSIIKDHKILQIRLKNRVRLTRISKRVEKTPKQAVA